MYTDGACRGNPGMGGWGALLFYKNKRRELHGAELLTTNNRMEMTAAIRGLEILKRPCRVELYTDSQYLRLGITEWLADWKRRNWKTSGRKAVKNRDLWHSLDEAVQDHDVHWHWVKGHAGNEGNERADALANDAIDTLLLQKKEGIR